MGSKPKPEVFRGSGQIVLKGELRRPLRVFSSFVLAIRSILVWCTNK